MLSTKSQIPLYQRIFAVARPAKSVGIWDLSRLFLWYVGPILHSLAPFPRFLKPFSHLVVL
jgi:hypothetical protein